MWCTLKESAQMRSLTALWRCIIQVLLPRGRKLCTCSPVRDAPLENWRHPKRGEKCAPPIIDWRADCSLMPSGVDCAAVRFICFRANSRAKLPPGRRNNCKVNLKRGRNQWPHVSRLQITANYMHTLSLSLHIPLIFYFVQ